jgi:hypothetical protein
MSNQKIGNLIEEAFHLSCINCGEKNELLLIAHRNVTKSITGFVISCSQCFSDVTGSDLLYRRRGGDSNER